MAHPKILAFSGSTRSGSFNNKLLKLAIKGAEAAGAQVTQVDLRALALPLYDGDLEAEITLPEGAKKLKQLFEANEGFLIASPEYNGSVSGVLKNAIDWVSRQQADEVPYQQFAGKVVVMMSTSAGAFAGIRSLAALRAILSHIQVLVLPQQVSIPHGDQAFNEDGSMKDARRQAQVEALGKTLADHLAKMKA
jgi:chromate reductase